MHRLPSARTPGIVLLSAAYLRLRRRIWRCSRCATYWSLVELLVALVLLLIFVVAAAHLRA